MISTLKGMVSGKDQKSLIVEVGGVGLRIFGTGDTLAKTKKGSAISLFTHLVVREDALTLYGFTDKETLEFFELLIGISGIGPKTAVAILNVASPETIRKAVASGDTSYLTKVSGIGRKNAEKIVLELKDKLSKDDGFDSLNLGEESDVVETLKTLGYKPNEIREALKNVPKETAGTSQRVKEALKILGK